MMATLRRQEPSGALMSMERYERLADGTRRQIAEIERQTIVTRVKAGLEAAKKRGVKLGAPQKITDAQREQVLTLRQGGMSFRKIAKETGLSYGAVHKLASELNQNINTES